VYEDWLRGSKLKEDLPFRQQQQQQQQTIVLPRRSESQLPQNLSPAHVHPPLDQLPLMSPRRVVQQPPPPSTTASQSQFLFAKAGSVPVTSPPRAVAAPAASAYANSGAAPDLIDIESDRCALGAVCDGGSNLLCYIYFFVCIVHYFIVIHVKRMLFASAMIHARFIDDLHTQRPYPPEAEFPRCSRRK
jgi:hypothetical protein